MRQSFQWSKVLHCPIFFADTNRTYLDLDSNTSIQEGQQAQQQNPNIIIKNNIGARVTPNSASRFISLDSSTKQIQDNRIMELRNTVPELPVFPIANSVRIADFRQAFSQLGRINAGESQRVNEKNSMQASGAGNFQKIGTSPNRKVSPAKRKDDKTVAAGRIQKQRRQRLKSIDESAFITGHEDSGMLPSSPLMTPRGNKTCHNPNTVSNFSKVLIGMTWFIHGVQWDHCY